MRAFVLYVNGKKRSTAGVNQPGVLAATVTCVGRLEASARNRMIRNVHAGVRLGGLDTTTDEHLDWYERELHVGDEVRIKVVDADSVDIPRSKRPRNRAQELRDKKRYVREMAKEFGWTVRTRR